MADTGPEAGELVLVRGVEDDGDGWLQVTGTLLHGDERVMQFCPELSQALCLIGEGEISTDGRKGTMGVLRGPS